jgi:hypothetical protein
MDDPMCRAEETASVSHICNKQLAFSRSLQAFPFLALFTLQSSPLYLKMGSTPSIQNLCDEDQMSSNSSFKYVGTRPTRDLNLDTYSLLRFVWTAS